MRVVQLEVDHRNRRPCWARVRAAAARLPARRSSPWVAAIDEPADLDEVERQVGLAEIGADRGDEVGEDLGVLLRRLAGSAIAFPLVPEHALDLAAGELDLAEHRAVEAIAPLALLGGVPLLHAGAAMGTGDQADWARRVASTIAAANGKPEPGPLGPGLVLLCRPLGTVLGSPEWTGIGRIDQPVERLLGLRPFAVHARAA